MPLTRFKRKSAGQNIASDSIPAWRLAVVVVFGAAMFGGLLTRLYTIQIVHHQFLFARKLAGKQQRGAVEDHHRRPLATNVRAWDLKLTLPEEMGERLALAERVAETLPKYADKIRKRAKKKDGFFYLDRNVDHDTYKQFASLRLSPKEGGAERVWKRWYPYGAYAGSLLGFTGTDKNGLAGIEYSYDEVLGGRLAGEDGPAGVRLTIDFEIQRTLEHLLAQKIEETDADSAMAVVMESGSGAVRAAAIVPSFDPNNWRAASAAIRRNRTVTDAFEPGSTIKPFVIARAMADGLLEPKELLWCENGTLILYDHEINDHGEEHGWLTPTQVLAKSSNICTAKVADRLQKEGLHKLFVDLGFGRRVQKDYAGEARGILRSPNRLSPVDVATMSFGQGLSVTPLQLAAAYNAIASGGLFYDPYFVEAILDEDGQPKSVATSEPSHQVFDADTNTRLLGMLRNVVTEGTGRKADVPGAAVGGKTGTAQVPDLQKGGYKTDEFVALFAGVFPVDKPLYTVVVLVENPRSTHYGGQVAAPVFREVARQLMVHTGGLPVVASAMPNGINVAARKRTFSKRMMPDFTGATIREVLEYAAEADIRVQVSGVGRVVAQEPAQGAPITEGDALRLELRRS